MKRTGWPQFSLAQCLAVIWAISLLYCEWFSWCWASWQWTHVEPGEVQSELVKILLVADPQLIGYRNEPLMSGPFSRWDADRYLAKGFHLAKGFIEPDLVVFLGDLFDEGSIADAEDFEFTLDRFKYIFISNNSTIHLYIPGDNDIGGEGVERVKEDKVSRFQETFSNHNLKSFVFHFLEFMQADFYGSSYELIESATNQNSITSSFRLLFSHMPLLPSYSKSIESMLGRSNPDLIISAHDHKAFITSQSSNGQLDVKHIWDYSVTSVIIDPLSSRRNFNAKDIVEMTVPTCTYRMGVPRMGYTFLLLEKLKNDNLIVRHTVFWLPGRYPQLYFYCFLLALTSVLLAASRFRRNYRFYRRR